MKSKDTTAKDLFNSFALGGIELKNRTVMAPWGNYFSYGLCGCDIAGNHFNQNTLKKTKK